jgi:hypothetical protein
MISLKNLVLETYELKERRVGTTKITALLEKVGPTFSKPEGKEITELLAKLLEGVTKIDEMQYSLFTYEKFEKVYKEEVDGVARQMIEALNKMLVKPSKKLDTAGVQQIVKALSEIYLINS